MGEKPQSIFELCPSNEDRDATYWADRHQQYRAAVIEPEHVAVTPLNVPLLKIFHDINAPLAMREHYSFGSKQILYAIIRAVDKDFGIVKAYGNKMPRNGFTYLVGLSEEPYQQGPEYFTHLEPKEEMELPDSRSEIVIGMDKRNGVWVKKNHISKPDDPRYELITAIRPLQEQSDNSILKQEVGIWAPPPKFVGKQASQVYGFKGRASSIVSSTRVTPQKPIVTKPKKPEGDDPTKSRKPRSKASFRQESKRIIQEELQAIN